MPRSLEKYPDPAGRSLERLRAHWEIERELADRLRAADRDERTALYGQVYDELFQRVPDHPQLVRREDPAQRETSVRSQSALVAHFLRRDGVFLEIGAGDCSLSLAIAPRARHVYAVEVSREIVPRTPPPENFDLLITDGRQIPVPPGSVDLAYSNQLMEHLHPDDAVEQITQIHAALRPGGRYICLTPNRLIGPADISMYFEDDRPSGFHLREYSNTELGALFADVGFARTDVIVTLGARVRTVPLGPVREGERAFGALSPRARRTLKQHRPMRKLLCPGGGVIATKA